MKIISLKHSASIDPSRKSRSIFLGGRGVKSVAIATIAVSVAAPLMTANAAIVYAPHADSVALGGRDANGGEVTGTTTYIDVDGNGFTFGAYSDGKGSLGLSLSNMSDFAIFNYDPNTYLAAPAASGTVVDGNGTYSDGSSVTLYDPSLLGSGYFGFEFYAPNSIALDFGWASYSFDGNGNATLTGVAYEDTGDAITVGATGPVAAVPEPAVPFLMTAGMLGFISRRRRAAKA